MLLPSHGLCPCTSESFPASDVCHDQRYIVDKIEQSSEGPPRICNNEIFARQPVNFVFASAVFEAPPIVRDRLCPQTFQIQRSEILSPEAQSPYNRKKTNLKDWAGMLPTAQLMCGLRPVMSKRRPCLSCAAIRGSQVQGCRLEFDIN